ncbi:hypothetical protein EG329_001465 [Mollisiaceae sp. DMI_Dod_QoI]|nr:hypothetical protein EG329_001465 [Helotiales sp. DMI_Dod_QoI]
MAALWLEDILQTAAKSRAIADNVGIEALIREFIQQPAPNFTIREASDGSIEVLTAILTKPRPPNGSIEPPWRMRDQTSGSAVAEGWISLPFILTEEVKRLWELGESAAAFDKLRTFFQQEVNHEREWLEKRIERTEMLSDLRRMALDNRSLADMLDDALRQIPGLTKKDALTFVFEAIQFVDKDKLELMEKKYIEAEIEQDGFGESRDDTRDEESDDQDDFEGVCWQGEVTAVSSDPIEGHAMEDDLEGRGAEQECTLEAAHLREKMTTIASNPTEKHATEEDLEVQEVDEKHISEPVCSLEGVATIATTLIEEQFKEMDSEGRFHLGVDNKSREYRANSVVSLGKDTYEHASDLDCAKEIGKTVEKDGLAAPPGHAESENTGMNTVEVLSEEGDENIMDRNESKERIENLVEEGRYSLSDEHVERESKVLAKVSGERADRKPIDGSEDRVQNESDAKERDAESVDPDSGEEEREEDTRDEAKKTAKIHTIKKRRINHRSKKPKGGLSKAKVTSKIDIEKSKGDGGSAEDIEILHSRELRKSEEGLKSSSTNDERLTTSSQSIEMKQNDRGIPENLDGKYNELTGDFDNLMQIGIPKAEKKIANEAHLKANALKEAAMAELNEARREGITENMILDGKDTSKSTETLDQYVFSQIYEKEIANGTQATKELDKDESSSQAAATLPSQSAIEQPNEEIEAIIQKLESSLGFFVSEDSKKRNQNHKKESADGRVIQGMVDNIEEALEIFRSGQTIDEESMKSLVIMIGQIKSIEEAVKKFQALSEPEVQKRKSNIILATIEAGVTPSPSEYVELLALNQILDNKMGSSCKELPKADSEGESPTDRAQKVSEPMELSNVFDFASYLKKIFPGETWTFKRLPDSITNYTVRATRQSSGKYNYETCILKFAPPYMAAISPDALASTLRQEIEAVALQGYGKFRMEEKQKNEDERRDDKENDKYPIVAIPAPIQIDRENRVLIMHDLGPLWTLPDAFDFHRNQPSTPVSSSMDQRAYELGVIGARLGLTFATLHVPMSEVKLNSFSQDLYKKSPTREFLRTNKVATVESYLQELKFPDSHELSQRVVKDFDADFGADFDVFALGDASLRSVLVEQHMLASSRVGIVDWERSGPGRGINGDMAQLFAELTSYTFERYHTLAFAQALAQFGGVLSASYRSTARKQGSRFILPKGKKCVEFGHNKRRLPPNVAKILRCNRKLQTETGDGRRRGLALANGGTE